MMLDYFIDYAKQLEMCIDLTEKSDFFLCSILCYSLQGCVRL